MGENTNSSTITLPATNAKVPQVFVFLFLSADIEAENSRGCPLSL